MEFDPPLTPGILVRRYKRFLADVTLDSGETVVAHCPNTGSMMGCDAPGSRVWLSHSDNPKRKLAWTWELVETGSGGEVACINTARANTVMGEVLSGGRFPGFEGYDRVRSEVRYGSEKSRIDWLLEDSAGQRRPVWIEVKNVTLAEGNVAYFPDAVTARGQKHLRELQGRVEAGDRAMLLFCVSHSGAREVRPAEGIDPVYAQLLRDVVDRGVACRAWRMTMTPEALEPGGEVSVVL
ncbi:DNA/RNA nuclease SfsA [Halovibrio salipaludis]|uniref:Sugar fermentation stimulation protein homolog n=1 Tax=Halovibrio salipaludis TaxID=2032626 RepID=A0A2A2EXH9_9GAMM|nr:DNA/RNA nuclease SfsA [Halovibrio salipaludis]PAU77077.1 DNA/RNA nuclease SfsA [Halovibrio salipaludis]